MTGSRTALERVQVAVRVEGPITLLIVPVAYSLFDDAGRALGRWRRRGA